MHITQIICEEKRIRDNETKFNNRLRTRHGVMQIAQATLHNQSFLCN